MLKRSAVKLMGKWEFGTRYQGNENLCYGVTERDSHAGKRSLVLPAVRAVKLH